MYLGTGLFTGAIVCALLLATGQTRAQTSPDSLTFAKYDCLQYIEATGLAPANVLSMDNNGEIVLAARRGVAKAQLKAMGVPFGESQIALLETYRLLAARGDTLQTLFPILGPLETRRLRERVQAVVPAVVARLEPDVRRLRSELARTGRERNAYTIIFSYVLDGLVWTEFEKDQALHGRRITAESPLWSGQVWAVYPPRSFSPGTNSLSEQGISLKVAWSDGAIPRMLPFVTDVPTLGRLFDDYREKGLVEDARAREVFGPYDLFDRTGRLTVPVIDESASNALYQSATAIAADAAQRIPALLRLPQLASEFGFGSNEQALVIAYHELMWSILDRLEELGLVQKPVVFANPQQAKPADISALVFVVRSSR